MPAPIFGRTSLLTPAQTHIQPIKEALDLALWEAAELRKDGWHEDAAAADARAARLAQQIGPSTSSAFAELSPV